MKWAAAATATLVRSSSTQQKLDVQAVGAAVMQPREAGPAMPPTNLFVVVQAAVAGASAAKALQQNTTRIGRAGVLMGAAATMLGEGGPVAAPSAGVAMQVPRVPHLLRPLQRPLACSLGQHLLTCPSGQCLLACLLALQQPLSLGSPASYSSPLPSPPPLTLQSSRPTHSCSPPPMTLQGTSPHTSPPPPCFPHGYIA